MRKIKKIIRTLSTDFIQKLIIRVLVFTGINNKYILFTDKKAQKNKVNLNYCHDFKNVGDNISPIIVEYVAKKYNINLEKNVDETKHLYAVGSILTAGAQDCVVWGSGILNTNILYRLNGRNFDVRSVRGPITRSILLDRGIYAPPIYGDPAILMPNIYNPKVEKKYFASVITHVDEKIDITDNNINIISITTDDYKKFVQEIVSSKIIISSSLHGIIFAEAYGVPAILLRPKSDLLKYFDYYYSTDRYDFPIVDTVEEALQTCPAEIPNFEEQRINLIKSFPKDLWLVE
ncbi:MAG: polysaccharide pyruvyl transferase family protein [Acutalibacteraceae bacterium]|nr:polysaccharide pyruvyl transferase family protein [Acutalibacteraceae bacterium]